MSYSLKKQDAETLNFIIYKLIIEIFCDGMSLGRKGAGEMSWLYLVIIMIAITAGFYIWQNTATGGVMPTDPEAYIGAWETFGDAAFKGEGQPWRMVGFFFFPLLIYFSMYYFTFSIALVGIQRKFPYVWGNIQRPVVVLSFSVAFIMLPFPLTYSIYGFIGGLSPILLVLAWVIPIVGVAVAFSALRGLGLGPPTTTPTVPPAPPPGGPTPTPSPSSGGLSAAVRQAIQRVIQNLRQLIT